MTFYNAMKVGKRNMKKTYILYNPHSGNGSGKQDAETLQVLYPDAVLINMTQISLYSVFFDGLQPDDDIILCGGDGTLNRFVNDTQGIEIKNKICYFACGSGNDFARDLGYMAYDNPGHPVNRYLTELPSVTVNGKKTLFINNFGFGIDGYCCEMGDRLREDNRNASDPKPINYTAIAIRGLLFHFKPRNAVVRVDGKQYTYKKVWLAPTMNGRYYGGGMMPTPGQDRLRQDGKVSLMVFHGTTALRTLLIFPSLFKGEHIRHRKNVAILEGQEIHVEFDRPTPLQIDGETISGVTSYTVHSGKRADGKNRDREMTHPF